MKQIYFSLQRFASVPKVLATVRHAGISRPQDAMNTWIEELQEDHFRLCLREMKTFDGKHQNVQVVSVQISPAGFIITYVQHRFNNPVILDNVTNGIIVIQARPFIVDNHILMIILLANIPTGPRAL